MGSDKELLADRCQKAWREWLPARSELERRVCGIVAPPFRPCWLDLEFNPETKTLVLDIMDKHLGVTKRMRHQLYRLGIERIILMAAHGRQYWSRPE
jgi:hypothetical protein